tara:strand:+ start:1042 stop:3981 length:2940 start_codon:yes stop_codon:yes gene_type:complete
MRFTDYVVSNSITNNLSDDKYDVGSPFNFIEYLNYIKLIDTNDFENFKLYKKYLNKWQETNFENNKDNSINIKTIYLNFFNDLTLKYSTEEQRRFFNTVDFYDDGSLSKIIPFYRSKIVEILNYYREKRNTFQRELREKQGKGSNFSVKDQIKNNIANFFISPDYTGNIVSLSSLRIDVELGYDTFNDYFDINPETVDSNETYITNDINVNAFLDLDRALVQVLNNNKISLSELNPYKLVVEFNEVNTSLLRSDDFIDYKITNNTDTYRVLFEAELSEHLVGTDYYYLSTTNTGFVSGKLFEAKNKAKNLFNINFPSVLAKEKVPLEFERSVGLFFNPTKFSILKVDGEFIKKIKPQLIENYVYIFPDPSVYGDVVNLSNTKRKNPYNFYFDQNSYKNISSSSSRNTVKSDERSHYFHSYQSVENRRINITNKGVFSDSITDLMNYGSVNKIETDIYGNEYFQLIPDKGVIRNTSDIDIVQDSVFDSGNTIDITENRYGDVEPLKGFYNKLNCTKQVYIKDAVTKSLVPLANSNFNQIYNKFAFNNTLYSEITGNSILDINVYEDTYSIDLSSFSIIDSFKYDGNYIEQVSSPLIIEKDNSHPNLSYITKDCFNNGSVYKFNISLSGVSTSNIFTYQLYKFDTNKKILEEICTLNTETSTFFIDNFNFNSSTNNKTITKLVYSDLNYNSYDDSFILTTTFEDEFKSLVLHHLNYKIINNKISIITNDIFTNFNNTAITTTRNYVTNQSLRSNVYSFLSGSGDLILPSLSFPIENFSRTVTLAYSGSVFVNFDTRNVVQTLDGMSLYKAEIDYGDNATETVYSKFQTSTDTLNLTNFNHNYSSFNNTVSSTGSIKLYYENGGITTLNLEVIKLISDLAPLEIKAINGQKTNNGKFVLNLVDNTNTLYNFIRSRPNPKKKPLDVIERYGFWNFDTPDGNEVVNYTFDFTGRLVVDNFGDGTRDPEYLNRVSGETFDHSYTS